MFPDGDRNIASVTILGAGVGASPGLWWPVCPAYPMVLSRQRGRPSRPGPPCSAPIGPAEKPCHLQRRNDRGVEQGRLSTREIHEALPVALREAVDEFGLHLARVDNRSAHTVRAYVGDVVSLLDHAARAGCAAPADLDIAVLRGWLAQRMTEAPPAPRRLAGPRPPAPSPPGRTGPGSARPTRGAAGQPARAPRPADGAARRPGGRPGRHRRPTPDARTGPGGPGTPLRHRRPGQRALRPGPRRRRRGPAGGPRLRQGRQGARRSLRPAGPARPRRLAAPRPAGARSPGQRRRAVPRRARWPAAADRGPADRGAPPPRPPGCRTPARTTCGTRRPPTCSTAAPTCARCRTCSGTPRCRAPRSTPTSRPNGSAPPSNRPTPAPDQAAGPVRSERERRRSAPAHPGRPAPLLARPGGVLSQPRLVRRGADRRAARPAAAARRGRAQPDDVLRRRA